MREKLIRSGSISKYLLYAIGEILLVMIGILLALQVNNWNEDRKKEMEINQALNQIYQELGSDLQNHESDIQVLKRGYLSNYNITQAILTDAPFNESMIIDFYYLTRDEYTLPSRAGYDHLEKMGISSLQDPDLEELLEDVYKSIFPRLSDELRFYPDIEQYFEEYYQHHFKVNNDLELRLEVVVGSDTTYYPRTGEFESIGFEETYTIGYVPLDYEELKKDHQFMIMLRQSQKFRMRKIRLYNRLDLNGKEVLNLISAYLGDEINLQEDEN